VSPEPCDNAGVCRQYYQQYVCQCTIDWVGTQCQQRQCIADTYFFSPPDLHCLSRRLCALQPFFLLILCFNSVLISDKISPNSPQTDLQEICRIYTRMLGLGPLGEMINLTFVFRRSLDGRYYDKQFIFGASR